MPLLMTEEEFALRDNEDVREEFVDGRVIRLAPESGSSEDIRWLLGSVMRELDPTCTVRGPSFQVRLRPGLRRLPDLMYLNAKHAGRVTEMYVDGAPDIIFEIVSKRSRQRDYVDKRAEYESAGVPEYWIVDPLRKHAEVLQLRKGRYETLESDEGWLGSTVLPELRIRPEWLWQRPLPTPAFVRAALDK